MLTISSRVETISPPVGKSGPLMFCESFRTDMSGSSMSLRSPAATSRRLWGGMSVDMPTAMPRGAIEQQVGQARRQQRRFAQGAVEIRHPLHGALLEFRPAGWPRRGAAAPPCSAWPRRISDRQPSPSSPARR